MDSQITGVLVKNDSDNVINVPRRLQLDSITEINYKSCFQADVSSDIATTPPKKAAVLVASVATFNQTKAKAPPMPSKAPSAPSRAPYRPSKAPKACSTTSEA